MDNAQSNKEIQQINAPNVEDWSSRDESENNSTLHYIAIKMDNGPEPKNQNNCHLEPMNPSSVENWTNPGGENGNNSTLLYIAVEYIKNSQPEGDETSSAQPLPHETYTDIVTPHVSPLDPNMSSVARYSPVSVQYQESCNGDLAPIIIHQYVTQENPEQESFVHHITAENSLENFSPEMPTVLCNNDDHQYLEMMDNGSANICENEGMQLHACCQLIPENDQQEVELLITDHATGISYSVNAQELLVERCLEDDQQLLEAIAPDPILESDLLSLDDGTLKCELNNEAINSTVVTSVNEEVIKNYIDCLTTKNIGCSNDTKMVHTRSNCVSNIDEEERLLSCVYSITDKPILSRARASLPESHLSIINTNGEDTVVAKKRIPKRTQFGPLKGVLDECKKEDLMSNRFLMLVEGIFYNIDVSDENNSNWMGFVRSASTYEEQNLIITQEGNGLYFTATRNIIPKEELKVGYSAGYARQFNLEILKPIEKKTWNCYECSDKFASSEELQRHFNVHDQERDENVKPPKRKCKKSNATNASKSPVDVVECNTCHEMFNANVSYNALKTHLADKHKLVGVKTGEHFSVHQCFQCGVCDIRFKLEMLLNIHKLEHDSELPLDQPNHVCPQCQRKFPTRKQLVLHVATHALPKSITKNDSVKCPVCHKLFAHSVRLQKHMLCHGSDESKPMQCKTCKKRFLTASALSFHVKIHVAAGEKQFECPICKERFDHVLKLRLHIPKHAHNNVYTCPHCKKTFAKYSIIRKHIRFHNERKHHCPYCPKSFPIQENLKKHMLRHSDVREFLCADCGRQFKRKDKLADHIKKLHLQRSAGRIPKVRTPSAKSAKEPKDFHRFIYKCHTCLVGFKRRGMLVNHLAKRHPDIRPDSVPELNLPILQTTRNYYCQYCEKVYKSSSNRKVHILKNHPGAALPVNNRQITNAQAGVPSSSFSTPGSVTTRPKNCQWCHRQYARKSKLLQHIRKAHPNKITEDEPHSKENFVKSETAPIPNAPDKIAEEKPLLKMETTFIPNEFHHGVLQKSQTTDGNMTEITPAVIDGLIDEDSKYCHLSIDENQIIESDELGNHSTHLYHLLTASNGILPPP